MSGLAFTIDRGRESDLGALPAIEREAVSLFAGRRLPMAVLEETTPVEDFRQAQRAGLLWVARTAGGAPIGFALVELVGGEPHLEEMDVRPAHGRQGVGRALLAAVRAWARASGHRTLTLTTFRDVPWNAPFYAREGFRTLEPGTLAPALAAVVEEEAARGLDPAARVVMGYDLALGPEP